MANKDPQPQYKVEWDEARAEYCIRFPDIPEVRLTPFTANDTEDMIQVYNEPSIGHWTFRRPFPFGPKDAQWLVDNFMPRYQEALEEIDKAVTARSRPVPRGHFPLPILRYVPTGKDSGRLDGLGLRDGQMLGGVYLSPLASTDEEAAEMLSRPPGEQVFEVAYDLATVARKKGLGKRMLTAALEAWVEWLGIGTIMATIETRNDASNALILSCGFECVENIVTPWPEDKGGGERAGARFAWKNPRVQ